MIDAVSLFKGSFHNCAISIVCEFFSIVVVVAT